MDENKLVQSVKTDASSWVLRHERIIIVFLVLLVGAWGFNHWINVDAAKKDAAYAALLEQYKHDQSVNDTNARATAEVTAQYQAMVQALTAQNAALVSSISNRDKELAKQQQQIKNMSLEQVARTWETQINAPTGTLVAQSTSVSVPEAAARQTATELARIPVLTANLIDETKIADNLKAEAGQCNQVVTSQKTQIEGLIQAGKTQDQLCKAEVAKVKADSRKGKRRWFLVGVITGFIGRQAIKSMTGF